MAHIIQAVRAALLLLLIFTLPRPADAAVEGVTVTLEAGEVVGRSRGLGTAQLSARVANRSGRTIEGIRIAAWYSPLDVLPPADADWRIHEFVFDPALAPGSSSVLEFSDDAAAQYVLLEARAVKFRPSLRYRGGYHDLSNPPLRRDSVVYISLRDLADVIGGKIGLREGSIVIEHDGGAIRLAPGSSRASKSGTELSLAHPVIEDSGRSYLALADAASLLGLGLSDLGNDLYELK